MPPAPGRTLTTRTLTRRSFVKSATGLAAVAPGLARAATQQPAAQDGTLFAYVGTYSSAPVDTPPGKVDLPPGNGRGIHVYRVDRATGGLTPASVVQHYTSPSALVFDAAGTHVYSTNATDVVDNGTSGTVSAFAVDRRTGHLTLLNTVSSGGLGPTYASIHPAGKHLLVANYAGGSVAVLPIAPDGRLGTATDVKKTMGAVGPKKATNAPPGSFAISGHDDPHAHMIRTDPAGRFVLAPDLGLDRIFVWALDTTTGTLTPADPPSVALPPGDGPRHFAFHPNGTWLYSIQEEGSTIVLFDYDAHARPPVAAADDLEPAEGIRRQQLLFGHSRLARRPLPVCRQPAPRQRRHLRHRSRRHADVGGRRVDARRLSAQHDDRPERHASCTSATSARTTSPRSASTSRRDA